MDRERGGCRLSSFHNGDLPTLDHWYPSWTEGEIIWHGQVRGHKRLPDNHYIHTSCVQAIRLLPRTLGKPRAFRLWTRNTRYTCYLEEASYRATDFFRNYPMLLGEIPGLWELDLALWPEHVLTRKSYLPRHLRRGGREEG